MIRDFIPGSEWIYLKIYTGEKMAEKLLTNNFFPFIKQLYNDKIIDKMFYLRYGDPSFHIRIRFHLKANSYYSIFYNKLYELLSPCYFNHLIWKIQVDTYKREVERYGTDNIDNIEALFSVDSIYTLQTLETIANAEQSETLRWQHAMRFIIETYKAFDCDDKKICDYLALNKAHFLAEFGFNGHKLTGQLNDQYRMLYPLIDKAICNYNKDSQRYCDIYPICQQIKNKDNNIKIVGDIIHMLINRFFISAQRKNEMLIYYYMYKYFQSKLARKHINN